MDNQFWKKLLEKRETPYREIEIYTNGAYVISAKSQFIKSQCRRCNRDIYWAKTREEKNIAFEPFAGEYLNHFCVCPKK
ncbi:MAG: hypothetical protein MUF15_20355 [Acidobacteria bacterium]|jgi:hypothetical protein|nr:hypothetical protein [Acidobacteriota bacterium]